MSYNNHQNFCRDFLFVYKRCLLNETRNNKEYDDKVNAEIQRTINFCRGDPGCQEELLGGFYRESAWEHVQCERATSEIRHCVITENLGQKDFEDVGLSVEKVLFSNN